MGEEGWKSRPHLSAFLYGEDGAAIVYGKTQADTLDVSFERERLMWSAGRRNKGRGSMTRSPSARPCREDLSIAGRSGHPEAVNASFRPPFGARVNCPER
jgi:hypothetical protein